MYTEVYKDIFQIKVRLPNNPLKELNSYLIRGEEKSLLIDTGFNIPECKEDLFGAIEEIGVDLKDLDVFLTHLHSDHCGLASEFVETSEHIYASRVDGPRINLMTTVEYWERFEDALDLFDLRQDNVKYSDHPGFKYAQNADIDFTLLDEGDILKIGDYSLEVIDTPGHTPGQIGLYEREHKLYFSGDHVLDQITPNIAFWGLEYDDLYTYIEMLDKISQFDIKHIFPAHRNLMDDHPRRSKEIIEHHKERIEEVFQILSEKPMTVRDVAGKMTWRIRANSWEEFPNAQKWFASSEAMSHLEYLTNRNRIKKEEKDGVLYYSLI